MSEVRLNAYRIMWLFVMFDLPTQTKVDKKNSARFRKDLEKDGFISEFSEKEARKVLLTKKEYEKKFGKLD